jgi:uncharacterized protein (TIGR02996 family)
MAERSGPSPGDVLERALAENPDDLAAHAAYGDWLAGRGDPRGELIAVQLALEDPKRKGAERKSLRQREEELLAAHAGEWLGPLAEHLPTWKDQAKRYFGEPRYRFARGWLHELTWSDLSRRGARNLAGAPQVRLLHTLKLYGARGWERAPYNPADPESERWGYEGLGPLVESPYLGNVRVLQLGYDRHEDLAAVEYYLYNQGPEEFDNVSALVNRLPKLQELYIDGVISDAEALFGLQALGDLHTLAYCYGPAYPLETLAANPALTRLRSLLLHPQAVAPGAAALITANGLRALLHSPHLQSLTTLRVHMTDMGNALCEEIVRSGILKRLTVLDLSWGRITDVGARVLARSPDLPRLQALALYNNALTEEGLSLLRKTGVPLVLEEPYQHGVRDRSYLYEGEME